MTIVGGAMADPHRSLCSGRSPPSAATSSRRGCSSRRRCSTARWCSRRTEVEDPRQSEPAQREDQRAPTLRLSDRLPRRAHPDHRAGLHLARPRRGVPVPLLRLRSFPRTRCQGGSSAFTVVAYVFVALPCVVGLFLAFKTRNVSGEYTENKPILAAFYTLALAALVVTPISSVFGDQDLVFHLLIVSLAILVVSRLRLRLHAAEALYTAASSRRSPLTAVGIRPHRRRARRRTRRGGGEGARYRLNPRGREAAKDPALLE